MHFPIGGRFPVAELAPFLAHFECEQQRPALEYDGVIEAAFGPQFHGERQD